MIDIERLLGERTDWRLPCHHNSEALILFPLNGNNWCSALARISGRLGYNKSPAPRPPKETSMFTEYRDQLRDIKEQHDRLRGYL